MKTCTKCGLSLSEDKFHKRTYRSGNVGLQPRCKQCTTDIRRGYKYKHEKIKHQLKLTNDDIERITAPGMCANVHCRATDRRLCIDHDHQTMKPRGLLCHQCNTALGLLGDDLQKIIGLSQYLAQSKLLE